MSIPNPFVFAESLTPLIVTRLAPILSLSVAVQGLPEVRQDVGFKANDAVTLVWAAWSPIEGQGNRVSGLTTQVLTLNCRISVRSLGIRDQVADLIFQRLGGWEVSPGTFLQWGGAEIVPPAENDPDYRMDLRFALLIQSRPPRVS